MTLITLNEYLCSVAGKAAIADTLADGRPDDDEDWGDDVLDAGRLRIDGVRLIAAPQHVIRRVADELERIAHGHGPGSVLVERVEHEQLVLWGLDDQAYALHAAIRLAYELGADELHERMCQVQHFALRYNWAIEERNSQPSSKQQRGGRGDEGADSNRPHGGTE